MLVKLRCSNCFHKCSVEMLELKEYKRCPLCDSTMVLDEDVNELIRKALSIDLDIQLQESINKLGLERVVELVQMYPHLRKIYKDRINARFGKEIIL